MKPTRTNAELIADALAALGAVRPENDDFSDALAAATLNVVKCLSLASGATELSKEEPIMSTKGTDDDPEAVGDEHFGASKVESAIVVIRDAKGPCRPSEILAGFRERDLHHHTGEHAESSLTKALIRRARKTGDVFKVPGTHGEWDLTKHYEPESLAILLSSTVIAQDVEKQRQSQRTKDGLARARARGARMGAAFKIDHDQAIQMKKMIDQGKSNKAICAAFKISAGSLYNYKNRLKDWNESMPWPPEHKDDDEKVVRPDFKSTNP